VVQLSICETFLSCHSTFKLKFYAADFDQLYKRITKFRLSMVYFCSKFTNEAYRADELERRTWLLLELISVRDGSCSLNNFSLSDIEAMIHVVCTTDASSKVIWFPYTSHMSDYLSSKWTFHMAPIYFCTRHPTWNP
jgi:hypothetical protein